MCPTVIIIKLFLHLTASSVKCKGILLAERYYEKEKMYISATQKN